MRTLNLLVVLSSPKKLKLLKRYLEHAWFRFHSSEDLKNLPSAIDLYHAPIIKAKKAYHFSLISSSIENHQYFWETIYTFLHQSSLPALPTYDSLSFFSHLFVNFFSDKIHKIHTSFLSSHTSTSSHIPSLLTPPCFSSLTLTLPSLPPWIRPWPYATLRCTQSALAI